MSVRSETIENEIDELGSPSVKQIRSRGLILPYSGVPIALSRSAMYLPRIASSLAPVGVDPIRD